MLLISLASAATWQVASDGSGDFTSISDAIAAAEDGDEIEVGAGTWTGHWSLEGRDLSLVAPNGPDVTLLEAGDAAAPLLDVVGGHLSLEGFSLSGQGYIGLRSLDAQIQLKDVSFAGFGHEESRGGAIYADGGELWVENCNFYDNYAESGGHIWLMNGELSVIGGSFQRGHALLGGAIASDQGTLVRIVDAYFAENTAFEGGALAIGHRSVLGVANSTFSNNHARTKGGAIQAGDGVRMEIGSVSFVEQHAKVGAGIAMGENGTLVISRTLFDNNAAIARGGGIWSSWNTTLDVSLSTFTGNSADFGYGGAIQAYGDMQSHYNTFSLNFSRRWGGALALYQGSLFDEGSYWSDNTSVGDNGGAVYIELGNYLTVKNSDFVQNNSGSRGGAIAMHFMHDVHLNNILFDDNQAGNGGSLYLVDSQAIVQNVQFIDNVAFAMGGAILAQTNSSLDLSNASFENSRAHESGGAISLLYYTDASIRNCSFDYSVADVSGGAIYVNGIEEHDEDALTQAITLSNLQITDSRSGSQGGSLYLSNFLQLNMDRLQIMGSKAGDTSFGGGAYLHNIGASSISNSRFYGNTAGYGGAAYSDGIVSDDDRWSNNVFDGNSARIGGALVLVYSIYTSVINNTFLGNSATEAAGGLALANNPLDFRNNLVAATSGGAALHMYDETGTEKIGFNDWWNNTAGDAGGLWSELPGYQNLVVDPMMVKWTADENPNNDRFQLAVGSPLIDGGDSTLLDPDGSRSDIGAYGGPSLWIEDADGDGFSSATDCNDNRADVFPGAEEVLYDGVDEDCDGQENYDVDGDGILARQGGGDDCDDQNPFRRSCDNSAPEETGCASAPASLSLVAVLAGVLSLRSRRIRVSA